MRQLFRPAVWEAGFVAPMGPAAPFISIGASLLGTAMSVVGQSQQASAAAGQANYQSQIARNNQIIAQRNADIALQQGAVQADQLNLKKAQVEGSQRAALAAQGGDVNQGSDLDIVSDTERAGTTDVATARYNATLRAWGFENEAAGAGATASAYSAAGSNIMSTLPYGIGSTLLGGIGNAGSKWYDYMRNTNSGGNGGPSPAANSTYGPEFDL
jgi:hypothetical protein